MSLGDLSSARSVLLEHFAGAASRGSPSSVCDSCHSFIKDGDMRYRCGGCQESYDLCGKCYDEGKGADHMAQSGVMHEFTLEWYSSMALRNLIPHDNLEGFFGNAFRYFSYRPVFGRYDPSLNTFVYISFSQLYKLVKQFASGLKQLLQDHNPMVAICSVSRSEWYIADLACIFLGITTVPVGSNMDSASMSSILSETETSVIVCSRDIVKRLEQLDRNSLPSLRAVIVMDMYSTCDTKWKDDSLVCHDQLNTVMFSEVIARGENDSINMESIHPPPTSVYTVMYTSGSTGRPKGCVFTRKTWRNRLHIYFSSSKLVWMSFLEPSHLFERITVQQFILSGGSIGFHRNSVDNVFDDFALVQPTIVTSTPRFWNFLYNQYLHALHQEYKLHLNTVTDKQEALMDMEGHNTPDSVVTPRSPPHEVVSLGSSQPEVTPRSAPHEVVSLQSSHLQSSSDATSFDPQSVPEDIRRSVLKRFRSILGGRQTSVATGGAPTAPAVKKFMEECFGGLVREGYGATEVGDISIGCHVMSKTKVKLIDVPEMGYLTSDNPPRGEICVQTDHMVDGYYKNDAETKERFVDGYFRTGDIGVMETPEKVRIIDRKKNIFKLAQGEFVLPERLENLYTSSSPLIEQVYVYGNSLQTNIVAVVVPHADGLMAWWTSNANSVEPLSSIEQLCGLSKVKTLVLNEMQQCARLHELKGWEVPADIILESEAFSEKNGLLTATLKLCRPNLEKKYQSLLEHLYLQSSAEKSLELHIVDYFETLATFSSNSISTYIPPPPLPSNALAVSFTQLGGDSLAATRLAGLIEGHFNKRVSVQAIMTEPLQNILDVLLVKTPGTWCMKTRASTTIDWNKEINLDFVTISTCNHKLSQSLPPDSTSVFLTGATGFLGQFVLLELLKNPKCQHIYCLVRGNKESPEKRIQTVLSELDQHFKIGEQFHKVVVVHGDLCSHNLGLKDEDYSLICSTVSVIIHNGAVVNAALPYHALQASNVGSTKEVIKMACRGCPKFLHYVSTFGVFAPTRTSEPISERSNTSPDRLHELSGYAQSKWVAETLVLSAIAGGLICGSISRPGLVGPHSQTGHANLQDWVCWLVRGLSKMRRYPEGPGCDEVIHFIPVDYVAKAVVYFSVEAHRQHGAADIFHVLNDLYPVSYTKLIMILNDLFIPDMKSSGYHDFRALLTTKAKSLEDPVLCGLDLLLPKTDGWSQSDNFVNKETRDVLAKAGIVYSIKNVDEYITLYLKFLSSRGLLE